MGHPHRWREGGREEEKTCLFGYKCCNNPAVNDVIMGLMFGVCGAAKVMSFGPKVKKTFVL